MLSDKNNMSSEDSTWGYAARIVFALFIMFITFFIAVSAASAWGWNPIVVVIFGVACAVVVTLWVASYLDRGDAIINLKRRIVGLEKQSADQASATEDTTTA